MFCLGFLIVMFVFVNWGKDTFLWNVFHSPAETTIADGSYVTVTGTIDRKEETSDYQILYLKNCSVYDRNQFIKEPKFILYNKEKQTFGIGNTIKVRGKLSFFEDARNPGNFSSKKYYQARKIASYMWSDDISCVDAKTDRLRNMLADLRNRWSAWIVETVGEKYGGTLCAVILGEKHQMDAEMKESFQSNGIAHILAISGLHLSFVGLGFYRLIRRLTGSYTIGGVAGMLFLLLYILMIGTTVSAVRAVIMFCIRVGADMSGRVYDAPTSLMVAALVVILWRPLAFYDAGFQLSFGALAGIVFVQPALEKMVIRSVCVTGKKRERSEIVWNLPEKGNARMAIRDVSQKIGESLGMSIAIQFAMLPVILWHYYQVPTYSVLLNLIVIPLMSVLLAVGFIGSILGMAGLKFGIVSVKVCEWILRLYEAFCHLMEQLPGHQIISGRPALWGIVIYYVFLIVFVMMVNQIDEMRGKKNLCEHHVYVTGVGNRGKNKIVDHRHEIYENERKSHDKEIIRFTRKQLSVELLLIVVALVMLLIASPAYAARHTMIRFGGAFSVLPDLEVTFLDVGQGDAIFIRERGGLMCMIDGGSSDVRDVGKYRIEPFLKSRGVDELDYVFVTHGDGDHICGIEEMIGRQTYGVKIRAVVFPEMSCWDERLEELYDLTVKNGIRAFQIKEGDSVDGRELKLTCLSSGAGLEENAASMVVGLSYQNLDILFTGDVEGEGEEMLTEKLREEAGKEQAGSFEILKVAHHGSKYSTSDEFLETVMPKLCVISAGEANRYGHPHAETLSRIEQVGAACVRTDELGAVTVEVKEGEVYVNLYVKKLCLTSLSQ